MEQDTKDILLDNFNKFLEKYQSGGFDEKNIDDSEIIEILDDEKVKIEQEIQDGGGISSKLYKTDFKSKIVDGYYLLHPSDIKNVYGN